MVSGGSITLGDVAAKTEGLAVSCSRCERAERHSLAKLIERRGRDFTVPDLLRELSRYCPKRKSISDGDLCGLNCPELSDFFIGA
jgi:hypothetical protein